MKYLFIAAIFLAIQTSQAQSVFHAPKAEAIRLNDSAINKNIRSGSNPDSLPAIIALLERSIKADSFYYSAWTNLLGFQCQAGHYTTALNTAKSIARIFPEKADMLFFYGALQYKTGHKKDAATTFNKLLKLYNSTDTRKVNRNDMQTAAINKGIVLILLDKKEEGKKLLQKLADQENDKAVKHYIATYASMTKEQILNEMIPGKR